MMKEILMQREDCFCAIPDFYDKVASKMGYQETDNLMYDCAKIRVTPKVQDVIFEYYKEVELLSDTNICTIWLLTGPKANLEYEDYRVIVEDNFFEELE